MKAVNELQRSECWRFRCDSEPDGWIYGNGTRFEVCESCGRSFESTGWDRYTPAGDPDE